MASSASMTSTQHAPVHAAADYPTKSGRFGTRRSFMRVRGTMSAMCALVTDAKTIAPDDYEAEFQRLYYDTATTAYPSSMAALLKLIPESQVLVGMLVGSDYMAIRVCRSMCRPLR